MVIDWLLTERGPPKISEQKQLDTIAEGIYTVDNTRYGLAAMICPTCKSDMIVVEHHNIELDYCTNCQGVWFDTGELELLLESMSLESTDLFLSNIFNSTEAKSSEKKRKCPICRQKMKKAIIGQEPEILIDVCWQEDGLWLDGGEVGQLIKQIAKKPSEKPGSQQQIITFLGEVFGARE